MSQKLSRREALKALAAATGVAVLSTLPTKWETPLVEIGAIPAHAQGSQPPGAIAGLISILLSAPARPGKNPSKAPVTVSTIFPSNISGVILNGFFNSSGDFYPYLINPVPPGSNYTVRATCVINCSYSGDVSPVAVTPGNTTNGVNFTFSNCGTQSTG